MPRRAGRRRARRDQQEPTGTACPAGSGATTLRPSASSSGTSTSRPLSFATWARSSITTCSSPCTIGHRAPAGRPGSRRPTYCWKLVRPVDRLDHQVVVGRTASRHRPANRTPRGRGGRSAAAPRSGSKSPSISWVISAVTSCQRRRRSVSAYRRALSITTPAAAASAVTARSSSSVKSAPRPSRSGRGCRRHAPGCGSVRRGSSASAGGSVGSRTTRVRGQVGGAGAAPGARSAARGCRVPPGAGRSRRSRPR